MTNRVKMLCLASACVLSLALTSAPASADVYLNSGKLGVTVYSANGTASVVFPNPGATPDSGTSNFYDPGTPVSNFGMQVGTDTTTFKVNSLFNALGGPGIPVTVTGTATSATVTGTFTAPGVSVGLTRVYSILPGANDLITSNTFTNLGTAPVTLRFFENNDPDQDANAFGRFDTINTVKTLGGFTVGEDTGPVSNLTAVVGFVNAIPGSPVGFGPFDGNSLEVFNGTGLNQLFSSPFNPGGGDSDIGVAGGVQFTLNPGQSANFTFDQGFGTSPAAAEAAFLASAAALAAVPEPTSVMLLGLGCVAAVGYYRRRKAAV